MTAVNMIFQHFRKNQQQVCRNRDTADQGGTRYIFHVGETCIVFLNHRTRILSQQKKIRFA